MYYTRRFPAITEQPQNIDGWLNGLSKDGLRSQVVGYIASTHEVMITVRTWKPVELDQVKLHSDLRDTFEEPAINLDEGL